jgi:hypothetical protein
LTYRDFAVYAAIVSVIGDSPYKRINRATIARRMQGYKTEKVRKEMIAERDDTAEQLRLTEKQIRTTVDRLHRKKLLEKLNPSRTQAFYSIRLSREELENALAERKTNTEAFRQEVAERNARLRERIEARKAERTARNAASH